MSGIYIPGLEMPTSCYDCNCFIRDSDGSDYCCLLMIDIGNNNKRDNDCPLVPVPPHGRLIDADVLIDAIIAKYIRHERNRELVFAAAEIKQDLADIINELPTIIEAEEGE